MTLWMRPRRNDEADKAKWQDLSGEENDGTLTDFAFTEANGWAMTPPRLVFGGGYVTLPLLSAVTDKVFTFDSWVITPTSIPPMWFTIVGENSPGNVWVALTINNAGNTQLFYRDSDRATGHSYKVGNICDGGLHHIVGVSDGSQSKIYVDNVAGTAGNVPPGSTMVTMSRIGAGGFNGSSYLWSGPMLAARVFSGALTPAEVAQNYAAGPFGHDYVKDGLVLDLNAAYCVPLVPKLVYSSGQEALSWR